VLIGCYIAHNPGPRNLFSPKRNPPTRGLTDQAQVQRLSFFRGNARSRKGVRWGVSPRQRLAVSRATSEIGRRVPDLAVKPPEISVVSVAPTVPG
jgi:hypothetical protein